MIYNINKNNGKGIGFSEGKPNETNLKACCECISKDWKPSLYLKVLKLKLWFSQNLKRLAIRLRLLQSQRTLSLRLWQIVIIRPQRSRFWRDQNLFLRVCWSQNLVSYVTPHFYLIIFSWCLSIFIWYIWFIWIIWPFGVVRVFK